MAAAALDPDRGTLLRIFGASKGGRLSAAEIAKKVQGLSKNGAETGWNADGADQALAGLIEAELLAVSGGAKDGPHPRSKASYRLTDKGKESLRPARPDLSDELLQAQEAFILLQVFRASEQKLTRSKLNEKLKTKAAIGNLEFQIKEEPATIDFHLATLVENGNLVETRQGNSVGYSLEQGQGTSALAAARQHEAVTFTMTGATLNALLASARQASPGPTRLEDSPPPEEIAPLTRPTTSSTVGPEDIAKYIDLLQADAYAGKDLIPIHAVRRLVAEYHGNEAAGHPTFDPLVKRMRSEGQLRLIAISDNRDATQKELDDSIPGMNEIIFFIVIR